MKRPIAVSAVLLFASGCAGGQPAPAMSPGSPPSSAAPSPTPNQGLVGKIGDTYVGNTVDVTVEEFDPHVTTSASSQTWQAALVKTCAKTDGRTVSPYPWQVIDTESGRYGPAGSYYHDAPKPLYPAGDAVLKGECVRGWILFDSSADVTVVEVRYSADGEGIARWML